MLIDHIGYWGSLFEWAGRYPELERAFGQFGEPSYFMRAQDRAHEERAGCFFSAWYSVEWFDEERGFDGCDFFERYHIEFGRNGSVHYKYNCTISGTCRFGVIQSDVYSTFKEWSAALQECLASVGVPIRKPTMTHIRDIAGLPIK